jgi:hypothetical protein
MSDTKLAAFKEFLDVVNERRPCCSSDLKKHHFIENIDTIIVMNSL